MGMQSTDRARFHRAMKSGIMRRSRRSQVMTRRPMTPPNNSAAIKPGRSTGRIPEMVLVNDRAIATAGLANDVEAVNQYAAVM